MLRAAAGKGADDAKTPLAGDKPDTVGEARTGDDGPGKIAGDAKAANGANSVGTGDWGMVILLRETGVSRRIIRSPLVSDYCTANNVQAFRCVCPG